MVAALLASAVSYYCIFYMCRATIKNKIKECIQKTKKKP